MNHNTHIANPFYANRLKRVAPQPEERDRPIYARLPLAPRNASPVPHLTSLYHFHRAGEYGDRSYPGNCGGNLIKDLLTYFRPGLVMDPLCCPQHKGASVLQIVMWCPMRWHWKRLVLVLSRTT
jgi:hypothetical protein